MTTPTYSYSVSPVGQWLRPQKAADYAGVSKKTLYRWIGERQITTYHVGGVTLLNSQDLDEFIQSHKQNPL